MNTFVKFVLFSIFFLSYNFCMDKKTNFEKTEIIISKEEIPKDQVNFFLKYFRFNQSVSRAETKDAIAYLQCARNKKEEQLHLVFTKSDNKIYWRWNQPPEMSAAPYVWFTFLENQYQKQKKENPKNN